MILSKTHIIAFFAGGGDKNTYTYLKFCFLIRVYEFMLLCCCTRTMGIFSEFASWLISNDCSLSSNLS